MLHFCVILGARDVPDDAWMAADLAVASALLESSETSTSIFTVLPFRDFAGCSNGRIKFGNPKADRLEVPVLEDSLVTVNANGATLKSLFLQKITNITSRMRPDDQLVILIAAHGNEDDGVVFIDDQPLSISDLSAVVKNNARTLLSLTACSSEKWLEGNVPWNGYVAAASDDESEPTPIEEARADETNECQNDPSRSHEVNMTGNPSTRRPLPIPQLTSNVLARFTLVRYRPLTSTSTTPKSTSFRERIENLSPIPDLDSDELDEFVHYAVKLIDATVSSANLVFLSGRLRRPDLTKEDVRVLVSAFKHRRQCQLAVESYIDCANWRTKRSPRWDYSVAIGAYDLEEEMVEESKEAAENTNAWRAFFTWKAPAQVDGKFWHPLCWTGIRLQLALAWDGAERPPFSSTVFLDVAAAMDDVKKSDILMSSPSMQMLVQLMIHHPTLCASL
ncbi:hypothetical protein C8F01DRAFT_1365082 [Mycena amicta]|nr:hypothetical protein C8F01DRAFT_1365082 [Mycena amicta]